ncbi:MAG: arylamine N-acetyltransferase [Rhodomicrobium sp.]
MIDLSAYFDRIGYSGPREASLTVLRQLHGLHPVAIPFENLDPFLGRPVSLDLEHLQGKLVAGGRGGYCFEQNLLFKAVLEELGFTLTTLAARVVWMMAPDAPPNPRAHLLLKVDTDEGPHLADVGFGGYLFSAPLKFVPGLEQKTPGGLLNIAASDGAFTMRAFLDGGWRAVYRFTSEPQFPIDHVVANWFTSTHPESRFRKNLMIQRVTEFGRVSLLNRKLTRRKAAGNVESVILGSPAELGQALSNDFQLPLPQELDSIFVRLPKE